MAFFDELTKKAQLVAGATCSVCGTVSDSNFCPHCGAPMGK